MHAISVRAGKTRNWTPEEMDGKPTWSYFNPMSWFGYGQLAGDVHPDPANSTQPAASTPVATAA